MGRRLLCFILVVSGCSTSESSVHCVPGQVQVCSCVSGQSGAQVCGDDGKHYTDCTCVPLDAAVADEAKAIDSGCKPNCEGRSCGPDPICQSSCGDCSGVCSSDGKCETGDAKAPKFLRLSANASRITPEQMLVVTAIMTDPDGVDDVIGGSLLDPDSGNVYGSFATSASEGSYSMMLSVAQINVVRQFSTPAGGGSRVFRAEFFDQSGHKSTKDLSVDFGCSDFTLALCGPQCTNLSANQDHCGQCFRSTASAPFAAACKNGMFVCADTSKVLCGSECANLKTSNNHCGKCFHPVSSAPFPAVCSNGVFVCADSSKTVCSDECVNLKTDNENCGKCMRPVPSPSVPSPSQAYCSNGEFVCPTVDNRKYLFCGDSCSWEADKRTCGSCNVNCDEVITKSPERLDFFCTFFTAPDYHCIGRYESTKRESCETLCNRNGLTCDRDTIGHRHSWATCSSDAIAGFEDQFCTQVPSQNIGCGAFKSIKCQCK